MCLLSAIERPYRPEQLHMEVLPDGRGQLTHGVGGAADEVMQHDGRTVLRTERDASTSGPLGRGLRGRDLVAAQHGADDDPHLLKRKARAEAPPPPAAERKPRV